MKKESDKRVAIFQAGFPVLSQTTNAAVMLADAGYDVELFLFNARQYVELDEVMSKRSNVQVHDFTSPRAAGVSQRYGDWPSTSHQRLSRTVGTVIRLREYALARLRSFLREAVSCYWLARRSQGGLLPDSIISQALAIMAGKHYHCLIGVEKQGLLWAGRIGAGLKVPFIYYSLELYTEDFGRLMRKRSAYFQRLRLAERTYHRRASATIIQDRDRADVLFRDNDLPISKATVFYVPVSLLGDPVKKRSAFLQEALGVPRDRVLILFFGQIAESRYAVQLAQVAQTFPEDWVLVMHGEAKPSTLRKIKALDRRARVVLSQAMVPSDTIPELVASADIGLALYAATTENNRLTAFSSEKMALYAQCGVPFIGFDYPGFRRLAHEDGWGMVIKSLQELPGAIHSILMSREQFRRRGHQAFHKYYDFRCNFAQVIEGLQHLC